MSDSANRRRYSRRKRSHEEMDDENDANQNDPNHNHANDANDPIRRSQSEGAIASQSGPKRKKAKKDVIINQQQVRSEQDVLRELKDGSIVLEWKKVVNPRYKAPPTGTYRERWTKYFKQLIFDTQALKGQEVLQEWSKPH